MWCRSPVIDRRYLMQMLPLDGAAWDIRLTMLFDDAQAKPCELSPHALVASEASSQRFLLASTRRACVVAQLNLGIPHVPARVLCIRVVKILESTHRSQPPRCCRVFVYYSIPKRADLTVLHSVGTSRAAAAMYRPRSSRRRYAACTIFFLGRMKGWCRQTAAP